MTVPLARVCGLACWRKPQAAPLTVVQPAAALRTGTDKLPILNTVVQVGGQGLPGAHQHDDSNLSTTSVWRSARTQAAAKVVALSSNGMDEIEIPALLSKQAD